MSSPNVTPEMTENIQYMTLVHELKASFPFVPDEYVKQIVEKVRN